MFVSPEASRNGLPHEQLQRLKPLFAATSVRQLFRMLQMQEWQELQGDKAVQLFAMDLPFILIQHGLSMSAGRMPDRSKEDCLR